MWDDLIITEDFAFDYRVEKWDESYIHVFLNAEFRDGICLFPKSVEVMQKEFDHRFYINKKELDIVASNPKPYNIFFISYLCEIFAGKFSPTISHIRYSYIFIK